MNDVMQKKPLNIVGLIAMFVLLSLAGTVLAWLYLALIDTVMNIWVNFFIAAGYGGIMYFLAYVIKKGFKISNNVGAVIVAILAIVVINYFKWQMYFGVWFYRDHGIDVSFFNVPYVLEALEIMVRYPFTEGLNPLAVFFADLLEFNRTGNWGVFDFDVITGIPLAIVWLGEFAVLFGALVLGAATTIGILLPGTREWASPLYLVYNFQPFDDYQLERLKSYQETDVITNQPLAGANSEISTDEHGNVSLRKYITGGGTVSHVAHLHAGDRPTDYILISETKASQVSMSQGTVTGKTSAPINLGLEKIEVLKEALRKLHVKEPVAAQAESSNDVNINIEGGSVEIEDLDIDIDLDL